MHKKTSLLIFFTISLLFVILAGCADKNGNPVGIGLFDRDQFGEEHYMAIFPAASDTFYWHDLKTGDNAFLMAGEKDGRQFKTIFYVDTSGFPENSRVDSAYIYLFIDNFTGDSSNVQVPNVYESTAQWDEEEMCWTLFHDQGYTGAPVAVTPVYTNTDTIAFQIPNELAQRWCDDVDEALKGLVLDYSNTGHDNLYSFSSGENSPRPYLRLYTTELDEDSTTSSRHIYFQGDAYVAHYDMQPDPDRLWIHNGIGIRSYLNFDLSVIPEAATINRALLVLRQDTLQAWPQYNYGFGALTDPIDAEFAIDPLPTKVSGYTLTGTAVDDSLAINIRTMIQAWTDGTNEEFGFLLSGLYEGSMWTSQAFYSTTADSANRPMLQIFYSLPPVTLNDEE